MKKLFPYSKSTVAAMLIIPTLAWCYIGLFLTMALWYPVGLTMNSWVNHLIHFSVIYVLWMIVFFSYRLFDWESLRTIQTFLGKLFAAFLACLIIAVVYFYFQPALLITPRRFLLAHLIISGFGIVVWYLLMRRAVLRNRRREVFVHSSYNTPEEVGELINRYEVFGLNFSGQLNPALNIVSGSIVVVPTSTEINAEESKSLFSLRTQGVRFIEYPELYESLTRTIHLSVLSDLWFVHSVDYRAHLLFDSLKRVIDIVLGLISSVIFFISYPLIAAAIKITSPGPVIFSQQRVGQNGKVFTLYKYRTMSTSSASNTWTSPQDVRITKFGRILRMLRIDELPQALNILKGDMSIVGPRPEQVNMVTELANQIPYYNERHMVKPGLTGWAQLHVYAGTLEETRQKLQYDIYYIKHRSLLFDLEIIVKTFYNVITFSGR